jgi:AraC-like DNA-binding protein
LFKETGCKGPLKIFSQSESEKLEALMQMIQKEYDYPSNWSQDIITAYLKAILIEFARIGSLDKDTSTTKLNKYVEDFQKLINLHYKQIHKVGDYADFLNITPNHLKDLVKEELGKSAKDLIIERIILEAKRMAHFTEKSSKEIGYDLGFEDPAYFSRFFSKQAGLTFVEFRESIRKKYN